MIGSRFLQVKEVPEKVVALRKTVRTILILGEQKNTLTSRLRTHDNSIVTADG
jgi:hypothetical protein